MSDSHDGYEYQPVQAKFCASLLWFVCRVSENENTADIPAEITSPFVITVTNASVVRPAVADYLCSGKMYLSVGKSIFKQEVDTLWDLIQRMSNRGVFVMDEKEEAVTDLDLLEKFPFNMHSHLALMDAIMLMYVDVMVTVQDVISVVRRFSTFNASKELPFDLEDAFVLWLNKINQCNIINHVKHIPQTSNEKIRLKKNQLVEKNVFPMVNELMDCVSDCKALLSIVLYYMPDMLSFNGIKMSSLLSQEDKIQNIELFRSLCAEHICTSVFALRVEDFFYASESLKTNFLTLLTEVFYELELSKMSVQWSSTNSQKGVSSRVNGDFEEKPSNLYHVQHGNTNDDPTTLENTHQTSKVRQHQPLLSKRSRKQFAKFEAELNEEITQSPVNQHSISAKHQKNVTHAWTPNTQLSEEPKMKLKPKISLEFRPDATSHILSSQPPDAYSMYSNSETGSIPHPHRSWTANAIYPVLPAASHSNHHNVGMSYPPSSTALYQPIHTSNYRDQHQMNTPHSLPYSLPQTVGALNYSDGVQLVESVKSTVEEERSKSGYHSSAAVSLVGQLPSYNADGSVVTDHHSPAVPFVFSPPNIASSQDVKDIDEDALSTITEGTEPDAPSLYSFHSSSSATSTKCNSEEEHELSMNPVFFSDDFHTGERKLSRTMSEEYTDGNRTLVDGEGIQNNFQPEITGSFAPTNFDGASHVRGSYTVNHGTIESALATGLPIITNSMKRSFDGPPQGDHTQQYANPTVDDSRKLSPDLISPGDRVIQEVPAQDFNRVSSSNRGEFEDAPLPVAPASSRSRSSSSGISVDYGRWHFSPDNDETARPSHMIYSSLSEQTDGSPVLLNGNEDVAVPVISQQVDVARNSNSESADVQETRSEDVHETRAEQNEIVVKEGDDADFEKTETQLHSVLESDKSIDSSGNQTISSNEKHFENNDSVAFNNRPDNLNIPVKEDDKPLIRDVLSKVKLFNSGGISPSYEHWPFRQVDSDAVVIFQQPPVSPARVTWLDFGSRKSEHSHTEAERRLKEMQDKRRNGSRVIHWTDLKGNKHANKKIKDGGVSEPLTERLTLLRMKLEEKRQRFEEEKKRQQALWNQERAKILQDAFFVMITDSETKQPTVAASDVVTTTASSPSSKQSASWEIHFEKGQEKPLEEKGDSKEDEKVPKLSPRESGRQNQADCSEMEGETRKQGLWFVGLNDESESDRHKTPSNEERQKSADAFRRSISHERSPADQKSPRHQIFDESTAVGNKSIGSEVGKVSETSEENVISNSHRPDLISNEEASQVTSNPSAIVAAGVGGVVSTDADADARAAKVDSSVCVETASSTKPQTDEREKESIEIEPIVSTQQLVPSKGSSSEAASVEVRDTPVSDEKHGQTDPQMISSTLPEPDQVVLKPPLVPSTTAWSHPPETVEDPSNTYTLNHVDIHTDHVTTNDVPIPSHEHEPPYINGDVSMSVSKAGETTSLEQRLEDLTMSDVNSSEHTYMTSTPMKPAVLQHDKQPIQSVENSVSDASQSETSATTPQGTSWGFTFGDEFMNTPQGMTPEQERKKARFLKNRLKKLEEGKLKKEAELEKKRKKEEKLAEQKAKEEEVEKLRRERLIEQQLKDVTTQLHQETFTKRIHELTYNVDLQPSTERRELRHFGRQASTPSPLIRRVRSPDTSEEASSNQFSEYKGPAAYQKPSGKSNRKIMQNAITHCCLCGEVNKDAKQKCLQAISQSDASHFLVLFREGLKFRSVYEYRPETETVTRIYGIGPKNITPKMHSGFFKYNSGGKEFNSLETKHLSIQVDGLLIKKELWEKKAGQTTKGNSLTKKKPAAGSVRPQSTR